MLKSLLKASGIIAGLALSGFACAVSLGGINVTSSLGEPLKAEIRLEAADSAEANKLSARLASPDAFKNAGVEYPYGLPVLTFDIQTNPVNGESTLKITSAQPVNEPFINLLVELNWPSGKLLREYTFLLDPPGYALTQPKGGEVRPVEPVVVMPPPVSQPPRSQPPSEVVKNKPDEVIPPKPEDQSTPDIAASPTGEKASAEPAPFVPGKPLKKQSKSATPDAITVKRGDTLRKLADQIKSPDVSVERMLVALYRANADAFDGKNMNRLKTGKILQVPAQAALEDIKQAEAVQEMRVQTADWNAYRQKLAAASQRVTDEAAKQEASGKVNAKIADQAPPAKESAKEVVRLSKGESPSDKAAIGGKSKSEQEKSSAQEKAQTLKEEAIAREKTIQESNERVAKLEKNIQAMQRLTELKSQMASEQAKSGTQGAEGVAKDKSRKLEALPKIPTPPPAATSDVAASSAVVPANPAPKPKEVVVEPSLLDDLLGQPIYLAGIAAVLLALLGLGFVRSRRGKQQASVETDESASDAGQEPAEVGDVGSRTGRILSPVAPSPDTGDFTRTMVAAAPVGYAPTEEVDPISEADLFLNFGRDEQAEEILKEALTKNPANHLIHLKLLSIYASRKDAKAFSVIANQLKDAGDAPAWDQAVAMGRKLDPGNPLYGGAGEMMAADNDSKDDVGAVKKQPAVMDFDLGLGTTKTSALNPEVQAPLGSDRQPAEEMSAPMDFDITSSHTNIQTDVPKKGEEKEIQLDDLIFDMGSHGSPPEKAVNETKKPAAPEAEEISFLLDFPDMSKPDTDKPETPPSKASVNPAFDIGLGEINLNLDEPAPTSVAPPELPPIDSDDQSSGDDISTKLDLAKAYQEMGDTDGAREILEEVVRDGNPQQSAAAQALLQELNG